MRHKVNKVAVANEVLKIINRLTDDNRRRLLPIAHKKLKEAGISKKATRDTFLVNAYVMSCTFAFDKDGIHEYVHDSKLNHTQFWSYISGQEYTFRVGVFVHGVQKFNWIGNRVQIRLSQLTAVNVSAESATDSSLIQYLYNDTNCRLIFSGRLLAMDQTQKTGQELTGAIVLEDKLSTDRVAGLDHFFSNLGLKTRTIISLIQGHTQNGSKIN